MLILHTALNPLSDKTVVNASSGPLDRVGPEAPGADMHGFGNTINDNPDITNIGLLFGQCPTRNLGTGYADFPAEKHVFLADITLSHLVHLLAFCAKTRTWNNIIYSGIWQDILLSGSRLVPGSMEYQSSYHDFSTPRIV